MKEEEGIKNHMEVDFTDRARGVKCSCTEEEKTRTA